MHSPTPRPVVLGKRRRISSSEEEEDEEVPEWYRKLWQFVYNDPRNNGLNRTDKELVFARILKRAKLPLYDEDERKPSPKMLECGLCKEKFSSNGELKQHLEQHASQLIDSDDESEVTETSIGEDQSSDSESDVRTSSEELALKQQCLRSVAAICLTRVNETAQEIDAAPVEPQGRNVEGLWKHLEEQHESQLIDSDDESEVTETSIGEDQSSDSEIDVRTPSEELALKQQCLRSVAAICLDRVDEEAGDSDASVAPVEPQGRNVKGLYMCDICKTSAKYRSKLIQHMETHHLKVRFLCSECQESFSRKDILIRHKKRLHQSDLRTCKFCGWSLICTKAEYYSHLRRRHPEFRTKGRGSNAENFNGVDFPCIYCEPRSTFTSFEGLEDHLSLTHDRNFACTRCPKAWDQQSNLMGHIESTHEKKTFKCTNCDKMFTWKTSLLTHLRENRC